MEKAFGYARVSSASQNLARQIQALLDAGIHERDIFADAQSGKDFARPQYQALLQCLRPGDTLTLASLDRLGRSYESIVHEWRHIEQTLGVSIRVLDMPLLNTRPQAEGLDTRFVSELVLQVLSYVAQKERENIRERQRQGIALARAQGKHLGRPKIGRPREFEAVYAQWKAGELTAKAAMERLGLKRTRFYEMVGEFEGR